MAGRLYPSDPNPFGEEEGAMEQSQVEEEEEEDWGLFSSSSPSSSSPIPHSLALPSSSLRPPIATLPTSPECSMDDDSSTDGEDLLDISHHAKRRSTDSLLQFANSRPSQATLAQQRRSMIKELQLKTQQECLAICRALLPLQQQWRQELEDPVPGLINHKEEERMKRKDISYSRSETQLHGSVPKVQLSAGPTNQNNTGNTVN